MSWIVPHEEYQHLGNHKLDRCFAYRELFRYQIDSDDLHKLRKSIHYCQPLGDEFFAQLIDDKYGIKVGLMTRGRPRKVFDIG